MPGIGTDATAPAPSEGWIHPPDVRIVDVNGTFSDAGLVQIRTSKGYGSICGMNPQAANQVCKELGYSHGWKATTPCYSYGGSDICGARGSPVAMMNLQCQGHESSVQDCVWSDPNQECKEHNRDSVIWCAHGEPYMYKDVANGAVRLVGKFGGAVQNGQGRLEEFLHNEWHPVCSKGFTHGSAAVACKMMGYSAMDPRGGKKCSDVSKDQGFCADDGVIPNVELNCTGKEKNVLECSHQYDPEADESDCKPTEAVVLKCMGDADTSGAKEKRPAPAPKVATMIPFPLPAVSLPRARYHRHRRDLRDFL